MSVSPELVKVVNGVQIKYKFQNGKFDCRHLLVVLSGFGWDSKFTYDFGKSVEDVPSYVLWIKDQFNGCCSLYSMYKSTFNIEVAVIEFIRMFIKEHYLDSDNVTILGASKGGAAALYLGTKYKFKNIIASAPQLRLGDFLSKVHTDVFLHMTDGSSEEKELLNNLINHTVANSDISSKNYVVICSDVDEYETCESMDDLLYRANSYVRISCTSKCVCQHNQITRYELPYIKAILLLNSQGKHPYFTSALIKNGKELPLDISSKIRRSIQNDAILISSVSKLAVKGSEIFIEGSGFIKGYDSSTYGLWKKELIFRKIGGSEEKIIKIGSYIDKFLSLNYYDRVYCDYSTGGFTTLLRKGINVHDFSPGSYRIFLRVSNQSVSLTEHLISNKLLSDIDGKIKLTASSKDCILEINS